MTLQGLTLAFSETGIDAVARDLVAGRIAGALADLKPPDRSFPLPDFTWLGNYHFRNIKITLTGGTFSDFVPAFKAIRQGSHGSFSLTMEASSFRVKYCWNEAFKELDCTSRACFPSCHSKDYDYDVLLPTLEITVALELSYTNRAWALEVTGVTTQPGATEPSIPKGSIVNHMAEFYDCFKTRLDKNTRDAVTKIDFQTPIQKLIGDLELTIPSTGKLTRDIAFAFGTGPGGLSFPGDRGMQAGVTGQVTFKGKPYAGGTPPQLPLPDVPKSKHLAYYAAAYEFDALFWAFFEQGLLEKLVTAGDLPDPAPLKTNTYKNTPLQGLYKKYPDKTMTAAVAATAAPTVSLQAVYDLSEAVLAKLKGTLPPDVFAKLQGLSGQYFLDEPSFYAGLVDALGEKDAGQWKATIENAARSAATVVRHQDRVTLNVLDEGKAIPVLTFSVTQEDVLSNLALGISKSGTTQTLQFGFQMVSSETKLVSTTIPSITTDDFGYIWNFVLGPEYAKEVAEMGEQGIALPRIPGFAFLFDQAEIAVEAAEGGYVSVLTDVEYRPSKVQAIGSIDAPTAAIAAA